MQVIHKTVKHGAALIAVLSGIYSSSIGAQEIAFPGLEGPPEPTIIPSEPEPTSPARFGFGGRNNLAVYLNDESGSWLGLAHGLKAHGVPFLITRDLDAALTHDVLLVYPSLTGSNTTPEQMQRLSRYVSDGNTLIGFSVIGRGMAATFGFDSYQERNDLSRLTVEDSEFTRQFVLDKVEAELNLIAPDRLAAGVAYGDLTYPAVASFDDGSGAVVFNRIENGGKTGYAYAIGFDIGHYTLRAFNGRLANVVSDYVNSYQPKVDTLYRLLAAIYWQGETDPIQLVSTPFNKDFTALVTHDIDFTRSMANIAAYAGLESSLGIPATYFIQTKYVTDYNDAAFFSRENYHVIENLLAAGMEIASHSVAHSNEFRHMSIGTGTEQYPAYRPFVQDFDQIRDASILGELRVSKFLLEQAGGNKVSAFRPGHLSLPRQLSELLQATGYNFSSSITANEALTHLPYQTMYSSEYEAETQVYEIPVTIEDELGDLGGRLEESIALANRIARHQGVVNLLIHTDETGEKLEFERQFILKFKDRAWFSTLSAFGNWWRMRDSVGIELDESGSARKKLTVTVDGTIDGLSLRIPTRWRISNKYSPAVRQEGNVLIFEQIVGKTELELHAD